jgi:peptidoglycan glycosyltransferase
LLNRAIQGLYPPGSVYKIVTAAATIENKENWRDLSFKCVGEENFLDKKIRCYNNTKHGEVDVKGAFAVSCNTTFAQLGIQLGPDKLKSVSERVGFNTAIQFPLDYNQSTFSLNESSKESELVETAIGQGKTLTTPLQMARITAAVANGGMLMKPYILDHVEDSHGNTIKKYMPEKEAELFSPEVSQELVDMMIEVVNTGTGKSAKVKNVAVAGKTGTAEVEGGEPHAWFVGFAPAQNPKVAVVVLLENGGGGGTSASPIAKKVIEAALNKN